MSAPAPALAGLWGVAAYEGADGALVPWPISEEEIGRDMASAGHALADLGVRAGDMVLWCSQLPEAGHVWPFVVATMLAGARLSCSDATSAEAARLAMFTRLLRYRAVMGVTPAMLDGLDDMGLAYTEAFAGVPIVGARPQAYERLVGAGVAAHRFALCGPAVAIGREPGGPALVDGDEWTIEDDAGGAAVTNLRPRATTFHQTPTAIRTADLGGST